MHQDELEQQREPAIWFRRQVGKASLSKLGGLPSLPSKIEWPRHGESGAPLHFLAQVDLSQLPPTPLKGGAKAARLPRAGVLFFFADMVEEMLWNENGGPLATTRTIFAHRVGPQRPAPEDIPDILHSFGQRAGGYRTGISVYPEAALEPHVIDTFAGVDPRADATDTYSTAAQAAMVTSIERAIGPLPVFTLGPGVWEAIKAANPREHIEVSRLRDGSVRRKLHCPLHQMLGIGKDIQGTAEAAHADGTILLFQIDSDTLVHRRFMFCDMGVAQFWIEPADLMAERFDRAWATTEGG
jgi:hypothetical protein